MHPLYSDFLHNSVRSLPFNSLYWDFCSVSLCPPVDTVLLRLHLSIPFIGIFVLYPAVLMPRRLLEAQLSIPFIGIFVLYPIQALGFCLPDCKTFNSLYWDFCSVSLG